MDYNELSKLIAHRSQQAYSQEQAAKKLKPSKQRAAMDKAHKLGAACDVAREILGEEVSDREKEERIKALFVHVICDGW